MVSSAWRNLMPSSGTFILYNFYKRERKIYWPRFEILIKQEFDSVFYWESNSSKRDAVMASCLFPCYFKNNQVQNITCTWSIPVQDRELPNSHAAHVYSVLSPQCGISCWTVNSTSGHTGDWPLFHSNPTGSWLVKTELDSYLLKSEIPGFHFRG